MELEEHIPIYAQNVHYIEASKTVGLNIPVVKQFSGIKNSVNVLLN